MKRFLEGTFAGVVLALELGYLASVLWHQINPDAPGFDELARRAWGELEATAQNREAIRRTLSSIRDLPETDD